MSRIGWCGWMSIVRNCLCSRVMLLPQGGELMLGSEKEKYDCAIGTSVLLTLLFAYDGVIMGMPHLNFWLYLVVPHVVLAAGVLAVVWRRGVFTDYPVGYVIGFTAFLALAMSHQQTFLHNKNDWRGTTLP